METPIQKSDLVIGTVYKYEYRPYGSYVSGEFQRLGDSGMAIFINNRYLNSGYRLRKPETTSDGPFYLYTPTAEASISGIPIAESFYEQSQYYPGSTTDANPIQVARPLDNNYEDEPNESIVILPESNSWSPEIRENYFAGRHRKTKKTKGIKKRKRQKTKRTKTRQPRTKKNKRRIRK